MPAGSAPPASLRCCVQSRERRRNAVPCRITLGGNQGRLEIAPRRRGPKVRPPPRSRRCIKGAKRTARRGRTTPPRAAGWRGVASWPSQSMSRTKPCRRPDRLGGYAWSKAGIWKIVDRGLSKASGQAPDRDVTWAFGAPRGIRTPNRQIRSLVLCVDLVGSRPIWPAHVGGPVGPDGSRRIPSDRLDDHRDGQAGGAPPSAMQVMGDHCGAGTRHSIW
jgi:hypothetical protein